jgi:hypothetical protein
VQFNLVAFGIVHHQTLQPTIRILECLYVGAGRLQTQTKSGTDKFMILFASKSHTLCDAT